MTGGLRATARVDTHAPGAAAALEAALTTADAVLVHGSDLEFADGALERLVRVLRRPHRRLVRVHTGAGSCYLARTELLATAVRHGVPLTILAADPPGLDREIAMAVDADLLHGPTPIEDPASGRWRQWVDGAVVGVRATTTDDPQWSERMVRRHSAPVGVVAVVRRQAGRLRRDVSRLRQRH